ncbi:MAG: peptidoglycan-associated lipoprotein Pal [Proteobacteria bacterium]|nr:peptidoglycan-associated lipoprotein Pal [Pseudomonadota bacterium]
MLSRAMNGKILIVAAAALLLAACESDGGSTGSGPTVQIDDSPRVASVGTGIVDSVTYEPGSQGELDAVVGSKVLFGYDRYDLSGLAQQVLREQADWMNKYPRVAITVEGHADERGTREYNLALGARRANAVKRYLGSLGVRDDRVRTISYGKERPEVVGSSEGAWSQNRRAKTVVE